MRGFSPALTAGKHSTPKSMAPPDVTFIYAEDVLEWDSYLSRQFESGGISIRHKQVEKISFPLGCTQTSVFSDARVVLVILSPALVSFLDRRAADSYQFTKLLKPNKTIAMVCGASPASIAAVKNVLISYDEWRHVEAKDQDINMVRKVIEMIQGSLAQSKETERINKPKFKLVPRKVHEGNGKVYVMLAKQLDSNVKVRITLEAKGGAREVPVKKRNPYTLVFVIPDELIHVQNMVNVHVWFGEDLVGVSSVKCASKLGELYSLLTSASSPYELMCNTLGVGSLHEVDAQLCTIFRKNLPKSGCDLLLFEGKRDKCASSEEFPTLLHFAARYGLAQFVKELLHCPGAQTASSIRNVRGLTPAQMANHEGHNKVAAAIDDFWKIHLNEKIDIDRPVPCPQASISDTDSNDNSNPVDYYDIPAAHPVPVLHLPVNRTVGSTMNERDTDYLKMKGAHKENIEPCQNLFLEEHLESMKSISPSPAEKAKLTLLESQAKLIEIMEAYKKGATLTEVERLQNEWKAFYQVSDVEAKSTLDGLRTLYAKAQKAKLNKKHSSSFSELRQFLTSKLRRKESIESKGNSSRRSSKDSNSSERLGVEPEAIRPVSTLSVHSNASSSSGSSFDRLSMASAGSDSGHHSDFGEDRNNKIRDRFESRYQQKHRVLNGPSNVVNMQKNIPNLTLSSKPPAPPPRPSKPATHYGSLEDCKQSSDFPHYSVSKKLVAPSFEEALKLPNFSPPSSKSLTLSNDWRSQKKMSFSSDCSSIDGPNADYDCPPPPRPSSSASKPVTKEFWHVPTVTICDPKQDYDMVPPPLPLSAPPHKQDMSFEQDQSYDIPASMLHQFQRSNSVSSSDCRFNVPSMDYDFPKTTLMDSNTDSQSACTCQIMSNRNNLSSVKSCCIANKMSSLKRMDLPSVPSFDISLSKDKVSSFDISSSKENNKGPSKVSIFEISPSKEKNKLNNNTSEVRATQHQYSNVFLKKDSGSERDSIPEELAPPPPILQNEGPEEHYKMVGAPIPITGTFKMS